MKPNTTLGWWQWPWIRLSTFPLGLGVQPLLACLPSEKGPSWHHPVSESVPEAWPARWRFSPAQAPGIRGALVAWILVMPPPFFQLLPGAGTWPEASPWPALWHPPRWVLSRGRRSTSHPREARLCTVHTPTLAPVGLSLTEHPPDPLSFWLWPGPNPSIPFSLSCRPPTPGLL